MKDQNLLVSQQSSNLRLFQGGESIAVTAQPSKPVSITDVVDTMDIRVTRISEWNKRMERLFARQKC